MNLKHTHLFFRNKFYLLIGIIGLLLIYSCTEDIPEPLFNNGVITGYAHLYNEYLNSDIEVVSSGPYGVKKVLTDSTGLFWITGLGNGTYELIFEKKGYGSIHKYGIQIFGNDTVKVNAELYEMAEVIKIPKFIEFYHSSSLGMTGDRIIIETNVPITNELPSLRFFLYTRDNVSFQNYKFTVMGYTLKRNGFDRILYVVEIGGFQIKSSTELFLKAYLCNEFDNGYFDNYHGYIVYSTLDTKNCSNTYSFKKP